MKITEYAPQFEGDVKDLLLGLQVFLARLDERGVLTVTEDYRERYFRYILSEIEQHGGKIFVAESDGKAVGMIVCKIFQGGGESEITTTCPKIGFISDLSVKEDYRRQGIGKALIARAEEFFVGQNCDYTQLEVFAPNRSAAELYRKLGFEPLCTYLSRKTRK